MADILRQSISPDEALIKDGDFVINESPIVFNYYDILSKMSGNYLNTLLGMDVEFLYLNVETSDFREGFISQCAFAKIEVDFSLLNLIVTSND